MKKNAIIITALIIVVAVVVYVLATRKSSNIPGPGENSANQQKIADKARVEKQPVATVLTAFPPEFPAEAGMESSAAYKYIPAKSAEQQSTLEYSSRKTFAENKKIFKDYLTSSGYAITNKVEESNLAFYYGTKNNNDLSVKIKQMDNVVAVSVSYLKR